MMNKKRLAAVSLIMAMMMTTPIPGTTRVAQAGTTNTGATNASTSSTSTAGKTVADMPSNYKASIEWVYNNRMLKEGTPKWTNLIFDQIFAGKGTLNYVVRWQSSKSVTLEQRKKIETMLNRQMNEWTKNLRGYDGWPFDEVKVKVVGWACANPSQILNKQPGEIVYTDCIVDDMSKTNSKIPSKLPSAPDALSRFVHYRDASYSYPGGLDKRFDMYLWATTNFGGGHGGDWGQRMSEDYILGCLDEQQSIIVEHEMGHGFGLPDFYQANERPPQGFPDKTIMWAYNSMTITNWDIWLLRYTWSQIKSDTRRFPANVAKTSTNTTETSKTSTAATANTTNNNAASSASALNTSKTTTGTVINGGGSIADTAFGTGNPAGAGGVTTNQQTQITGTNTTPTDPNTGTITSPTGPNAGTSTSPTGQNTGMNTTPTGQNAGTNISPTAGAANSSGTTVTTNPKSSGRRSGFFKRFASLFRYAFRR